MFQRDYLDSYCLSVLYACVLYFCICTCSAQLCMERHSRNTLIIFYYYYYYIEHVHCSLRKVGIHSCSYCLDSKTLTEEQREEIFSKICDNTDMMGWMVHILSSACISRSMLRRYARTLNISLRYIGDCVSYGEIILNFVKRKEWKKCLWFRFSKQAYHVYTSHSRYMCILLQLET